MAAREALGRGLAALLEGADASAESELTEVPVAHIRPNPFQPRSHFDPERLRELAASIQQQGVIQPIVVRRNAEGYELLAGERRLRAAQMAGYTTIPALVKSANDQEALEVALLENLQREDLNPVEEARAYQRLQKEFDLTQDEVAQRVGRDRSSVTNMLRLLRLPPSIQADMEAGPLEHGARPRPAGPGVRRGAAAFAQSYCGRGLVGAGDGKPGARGKAAACGQAAQTGPFRSVGGDAAPALWRRGVD